MPNDRSTISGIAFACTVRRDVGASVNVLTTGAPFSSRNVTVAVFCDRRRIREQHVRVEEALRSFGEEPRRRRTVRRLLRVRAVAGRIPAHRALDDERKRRGRRDRGGDLGVLEAGDLDRRGWSCATSAPASASGAPSCRHP